MGVLALALGLFFLRETNPPGPEGARLQNGPAAPGPVVLATPTTAPAANEPDDVTEPATTGDGTPIVPTAMNRISMRLPGDATIDVPDGSFLEAAIKFLREESAREPRTFTADSLVFDQDSRLTDEAMHTVGDLAAIAKAYPRSKLRIEAHEAPGGASDHDERMATARKRANAVRDAIVQAGVPADRVASEVRAADLLDAADLNPASKPVVDVVIAPE